MCSLPIFVFQFRDYRVQAILNTDVFNTEQFLKIVFRVDSQSASLLDGNRNDGNSVPSANTGSQRILPQSASLVDGNSNDGNSVPSAVNRP